MSKVTKADLIHDVAQRVGMTKTQTEKTVNALFDGLTSALQSERKISLVGFGTFYISSRAQRAGLNPQNGQKISIPPAKVARFRVGKNLKEAVNR